jgi:hypothetical protein
LLLLLHFRPALLTSRFTLRGPIGFAALSLACGLSRSAVATNSRLSLIGAALCLAGIGLGVAPTLPGGLMSFFVGRITGALGLPAQLISSHVRGGRCGSGTLPCVLSRVIIRFRYARHILCRGVGQCCHQGCCTHKDGAVHLEALSFTSLPLLVLCSQAVASTAPKAVGAAALIAAPDTADYHRAIGSHPFSSRHTAVLGVDRTEPERKCWCVIAVVPSMVAVMPALPSLSRNRSGR